MQCVKNQIIISLAEQMDIDVDVIERLIEVPPDSNLGDYAFPCFQLSKTLRKEPNIIAAEIGNKIKKPETIERIDITGGYINFFIDKEQYSTMVMKEIIKNGQDYGRSDVGNEKTVVIDYCSTNIAKPFHIGHLPTTVIGNSLYKIYNFLGYTCVGINHLGDWGTQFGKLIVAYRKWGEKEEIDNNPIKELVKIYVRFHKEAEIDDKLNDEARAAFKSIEDGQQEYVELWKWFKKMSIVEFRRILEILKIDFDSWNGESFFNDKMESVITELSEKGLLIESQGAKIVDLSEFDMPPCIVLRSDGATLYSTRDLAAIFYRKETYKFDKMLYCVATQQNLHFQQVFKVIELMGYEWAKDLVHVANGMISFEDGAISTRKGTAVYLDDLLNEAIAKSLKKIEEKNPLLEGKEEVSKIVGIGAVKFSALKNRRMKDSIFIWDKVLNFEGETSCYIQYTYARICSILKCAGNEKDLDVDYSLLTDEESYSIIKCLAQFPETVMYAADEFEPSIISKYLIDLVQCFNKFYHVHRVLDSEGKLRDTRIELCKAVTIVVASGMKLLGLECPERM